jgi:AcrR family transcriptional regulator
MTSTPTESRSADRILLSSLQLFSTKGYDATSVREICEAAGITKPTLYHFYGSKEGVYRALVEGVLAPFASEVERVLDGPGSVRERLRAIARVYFQRAGTEPELTRFIFGLVHNPPSSAPEVAIPAFYKSLVAKVAAAVEDGVRAGELAPGHTGVRMLVYMGALAETVCGFLIIGEPVLSDELADALVDAVLDGWTPGARR